MIRRRLIHARSANSLRAAIALELAGVAFERTELDLAAGDHRSPAHLALDPAGKVPVYLEDDFVLTQSGAIALHVLSGARTELVPGEPRRHAAVMASLCAAISDIAVQNALMRYMAFDRRNVGFLRARLVDSLRAALAGLADHRFVCGDALSIADVAHYPVVHMRRPMLAALGGFDHVLGWADRLRTLAPFGRAIAWCGLELPFEGDA
jgi:GST-like protein